MARFNDLRPEQKGEFVKYLIEEAPQEEFDREYKCLTNEEQISFMKAYMELAVYGRVLD